MPSVGYAVKVVNMFGAPIKDVTFKVTKGLMGNQTTTTFTTNDHGIPEGDMGIIYTYEPMDVATFNISKTGYETQSGQLMDLKYVSSDHSYTIILFPSGITNTSKCPTYMEIAKAVLK